MSPALVALISLAMRYLPPILGTVGVATSETAQTVQLAGSITAASSMTDDLQLIGSVLFTIVTLGIQFWQKLKAERNKAPVEERTIPR